MMALNSNNDFNELVRFPCYRFTSEPIKSIIYAWLMIVRKKCCFLGKKELKCTNIYSCIVVISFFNVNRNKTFRFVVIVIFSFSSMAQTFFQFTTYSILLFGIITIAVLWTWQFHMVDDLGIARIWMQFILILVIYVLSERNNLCSKESWRKKRQAMNYFSLFVVNLIVCIINFIW